MELYPGWSARDNYGYGSKKKKRKKDRSPADSGGINQRFLFVFSFSFHLLILRWKIFSFVESFVKTKQNFHLFSNTQNFQKEKKTRRKIMKNLFRTIPELNDWHLKHLRIINYEYINCWTFRLCSYYDFLHPDLTFNFENKKKTNVLRLPMVDNDENLKKDCMPSIFRFIIIE